MCFPYETFEEVFHIKRYRLVVLQAVFPCLPMQSPWYKYVIRWKNISACLPDKATRSKEQRILSTASHRTSVELVLGSSDLNMLRRQHLHWNSEAPAPRSDGRNYGGHCHWGAEFPPQEARGTDEWRVQAAESCEEQNQLTETRLSSINAFLRKLSDREEWRDQVREMPYEIEDCIDN